ncbi:MAG: hypothetical protein U9N13_06325, partial [Euryarchaeota archaeon]|nr:hypothetical protein [Euryarchaeota archaeon]
MKVRLELLDDEDEEVASVKFQGKGWKDRVIKFIQMFEDTQLLSSEPSSQRPHEQHTQQPILQGQQGAAQPLVPAQPYQQPQPPYPQPVYQPPQYPMPTPYYYPTYFQSPPQQCPIPPTQNTQSTDIRTIPPTDQRVNGPGMQVTRETAQPRPRISSFRNRISDTSLTISERLEMFLKYEYP